MEHQAEVEAEIRVEEEEAAELKSEVETATEVKKSLEEQQHQADTALRGMAENRKCSRRCNSSRLQRKQSEVVQCQDKRSTDPDVREGQASTWIRYRVGIVAVAAWTSQTAERVGECHNRTTLQHEVH